MMSAGPEVEQRMSTEFLFTRSAISVLDLLVEEAFDVVYFDAFGPAAQPELWTEDVFRRMHCALHPGGTLVTYCAKGSVRRAMIAAGFKVERLKAMWGKREMFRAVRPSRP
jgi:tRNA U34 5-methylaminomethyl-2-thiouridine-forming methyltransferase MnmC